MIEFHPLANIFPLLSGREFDDLVYDIKTYGLREPVVLFKQRILDGRNRERACEAAGVVPTYVEFDGDDALRFVISKNLVRRHLRDSQRALIAAELATTKHGGNQHTKDGELTHTDAAQLLRVNLRTVRSATVVKNKGCDQLKETLRAGAISVDAAARIARLPATKQREIVERGARAIVSESRKTRRTHSGTGRQQYGSLWKFVDAICDALEASDLNKAHGAASDLQKEIKRVAASRRAVK